LGDFGKIIGSAVLFVNEIMVHEMMVHVSWVQVKLLDCVLHNDYKHHGGLCLIPSVPVHMESGAKISLPTVGDGAAVARKAGAPSSVQDVAQV
jgi:hypothetical protein